MRKVGDTDAAGSQQDQKQWFNKPYSTCCSSENELTTSSPPKAYAVAVRRCSWLGL